MYSSKQIKKLPLKIEMTKDDSCTLNGPVANVVFSFWSSTEFMVAHPLVIPIDNVNKLPVFSKIFPNH